MVPVIVMTSVSPGNSISATRRVTRLMFASSLRNLCDHADQWDKNRSENQENVSISQRRKQRNSCSVGAGILQSEDLQSRRKVVGVLAGHPPILSWTPLDLVNNVPCG